MTEEQVYTVKVDKWGTIAWYNAANQLHRLTGPAVECTDGFKSWYINGSLHRLDGPAVEYASGTKCWFQNGKLHRLDGPACEWVNGYEEWYIEGDKLTETEFNERTEPDPCDGQYITLEDGRKYLLTAIKGE